jgi:hypothetical protein
MQLESNFYRRHKAWGIVAVLAVFLLVFRLEYWTPMQSDDYFYFLKGLSLQATVHQYLHWSGRLVADFISSALLHLGSHFLTTLLNAVAVVALALVIACMPLCASGRESARVAGGGFSATVFLLVFFLYWVSNPAIGQTSLWIVGSANYLWTNLLLCLFLLGFLSELRRADPGPGPLQAGLKTAALCALALIAGCSNENTSVTALALIVFLAWRQYRNGGGSAKLWCYVLAFAAGAAVLLLAPGNFERYHSRGYHEWEQLSIGMRTLDHLYRRFPNAMAQYWETFLVLLALARFGPRWSRDSRFYVLLFVTASFVVNLALLPAPHIPRRAMNGGLVYLLIALSFAAYDFLARMRALRIGARIAAAPTPGRKRRARLLTILTLICGLHFAAVYYFMCYAYRGAYVQAQVRDSIIRQGIANGQSHIEIPDFFFSRLLRERHQFDRYFNGRAMARYYGTTAVITQYKVRNNYSLTVAPVRR